LWPVHDLALDVPQGDVYAAEQCCDKPAETTSAGEPTIEFVPDSVYVIRVLADNGLAKICGDFAVSQKSGHVANDDTAATSRAGCLADTGNAFVCVDAEEHE
jgi:hypothetical protein